MSLLVMPSVALVWADGGYRSRLLGWARCQLRVVEIVAKIAGPRSLSVLPRPWMAERTLS